MTPGATSGTVSQALDLARPEPGHAHLPPPAPPLPDDTRQTPADFIVTGFLRKHLLLALLLLPALLGLAAAFLVPPRFTAEAVLIVLSTRDGAASPGLSGFGPSVVSVEITKAVRSEAEFLRSEPVIRRAVATVGPERLYPGLAAPRRLPWQRGEAPPGAAEQLGLATELVQRALRIETEPGSNVLRVGFPLADRGLAVETLAALVDAFYERRRETYAEDGARLVGAELARHAEELRRLEAAIQQVKGRFGVLDIRQELQLTASRLDGLAQREDRAREQQATSAAQLAAAQERLAALPPRVLAAEEATNVIPADDARNQLARLQQERQQMAANYQADYPGLLDLDRRIEAARRSVASSARTNLSTRRETRNPVVEQLEGRIAALQVETGAWTEQLAELQRQKAELQQRRLALLEAERQLRDLERQRDALDTVARQFVAREAGTRLDEDARRQQPPGVRTVQAATAPPTGRSYGPLFVAAGGAAGLLSAGLALLALTLGRMRLVTPSEAERRLRLPALGVFGRDAPTAAPAADLAALLLDIRIGLDRPRILRFVTTAEGGEDSAVVQELAAEFARRRGLRTLLIDLRPGGRAPLAALGPPWPEGEPPVGKVPALSAVVPNLWLADASWASRLVDPQASREQVETLIAQLREAFGMVLVLGPDAAEESYAVARLSALVDANVVMVRAARTTLQAARAGRDFVLGARGALLGCLITGYRRVVPAAVARLI